MGGQSRDFIPGFDSASRTVKSTKIERFEKFLRLRQKASKYKFPNFIVFPTSHNMILGRSLVRGRIPTSCQMSHQLSVKFFHSHLTRPSINSSKMQLKFQSTRQVLWSYASAPSNVLFLTTNLIGLGVLSTYRFLNTMTHTVESKGVKEAHIRTDKIIMENVQGDLNLLEIVNGSILEGIDTTVFHEGENEEIFSTSGLPLTEMDLNELGPAKTRSVFEEHSNHVIVKQLLSLYHIHNSFNQVFNKEGVNVEILTSLNKKDRETFVFTLLELIPDHERLHLKSFSDIIKNLDIDELHKNLRAMSLNNDYHLYNTISEELTLNDIENTPPTIQPDALSITEVLKKYRDSKKLDTTFMLDTVTSFMNKSVADINYVAVYDIINKRPDNENFRLLGNLLSTRLLKSDDTIRNEKLLHLMLKNTIQTKNRTVFNKLLAHLNISNSDLLRDKSKKSIKLVRRITEGSNLHSYSYRLDTYLTAIKGLYLLEYTNDHVINAIKKLFKTLTNDNRVTYFNDFNDINSFSLNFDDFVVGEDIDKVLLKIIKNAREL